MQDKKGMNQEALREAFVFSEQEFFVKKLQRNAKGTLVRKTDGRPVGASPRRTQTEHLRFSFQATSVYLHRAIYIWHHGAIGEGLVVRHLNGDPLDNRPGNLALGLAQDNSNDRRTFSFVELPGKWMVLTSVSGYHVRAYDVEREQALRKCGEKVTEILEIMKRTGFRYFKHTPEELRAMLSFDPETNTFTVKQTPKGCAPRAKVNLPPGKTLAASGPRGQISLEGQLYTIYEIVFLMFHGQIPVKQTIHHIDFNCNNNRPENLTLLSVEENSRLGNGHPVNEETSRGFSLDRRKKKFHVYVQVEGKRVWLGYAATENEARVLAQEARQAVLKKTFVRPSVLVQTFCREQVGKGPIDGTTLHKNYLDWCKSKNVFGGFQRPANFCHAAETFPFVQKIKGKKGLWYLNCVPEEAKP